MASYQFLQSSFAYGEISPRLIGRSDTDRYRQSLRVCENALTFSHGNCVKRPGAAFIKASTTEADIRLLDLQAEINIPYVLELGQREAGGYVRVFNHDDYALGQRQYIANQSFNDQLNGWFTDVVEPDALQWRSPTYAEFVVVDADANFPVLYQEVDIPAGQVPGGQYRITVNVIAPPNTLEFAVGNSLVDQEAWLAYTPITALETTFTVTVVPGPATFSVFLRARPEAEGEVVWANSITMVDAGAPSAPFEAPTPYSSLDLPELAYASATHLTSLYIVHPDHPPYRFVVVADGTFVWEPVPFTTQPSQWVARNYPSAITFHQQRLWMAATPNQPDTLWATRTALFDDFALGSGNPTDGIEFEMADRGVIKWIAGARDLLVGGDVAEYIITSEGAAIAPGDISSRQQSSYGSARHTPAGLGNGVLYLGNDRRRIRFQNYQFLEDGWVSVDITWPSEHVTAPLVKEIHFRYAPDPIIFLILFDGSLVTAIYEREQNDLVGWHRHFLPGGEIVSGAVTKLEADNEFWMAVRREIDDQEVVYIERMTLSRAASEQGFFTNRAPLPRRILDIDDIYVDSAVYRTVEENPIGSGDYEIDQLEHLEGQTVQIVIDDAVHIERVVENGVVKMQKGFQGDVGSGGATVAIVGVGYEGLMRTLPLEGGNRGGTAQPTKKRRNRIFVRILNSALPLVNGVETGARFPMTPMGEGEDNFTGDLQVANLGWDRFAEVEIRMPKPRAYNVLAIFGDAETNTF